MDIVNEFLAKLLELIGPQITALLALTAAQVLTGVGVAIKNKNFEWKQLTDFFGDIVIPQLFGWVGVVIISKFVLESYLPAELGSGIKDGTFLMVVASFTGAIVTNLRALGVLPKGINPTLDKVGIRAKTED